MALNMEAAVRIKADVDGVNNIVALNRALQGTQGEAKETAGALGRLKGAASGIGGLLGALIPAAALAGLAAFAKRSIDAADHLYDLSQRTGVAVETLSKFGNAAADSGSSVDEVAKGMARLSKGMVAAGAGANDYATKVKSASDDALEAIKRGEREQTDLVKEQGRDRLDALENETDARLRELNKRYRREQGLLDDRYDDQADADRELADESLRKTERAINQRYDKMRRSIDANEGLADADRENQLNNLKLQEEDELHALNKRHQASQKMRGRQLRDRRRAEEDALEERKMSEESIIKNNQQSQAKMIESATAAQLEAIKAQYKDAADALENNSKSASNALAELGISATDSAGKLRPVDQVMLDIADKFSKMEDPAKKAALAQELFGKAGVNLIPMLDQGRAGLEKYQSTISTEMAAAADQFNDTLAGIGRTIAGPFNQALTAALPYITEFAQKFAAVLPSAIQAVGNAIVSLLPLAIQLGQGIAGLATWFSSLPGPVQTILGIMTGLTAAFIAFAPAITALVSVLTLVGPLFTGIAAALVSIPALIAGWAGAIAPLMAALAPLGQLLLAIFSGPVGWVALLVAAGVAIYAFRDQIGDVFNAIGGILQAGAAGFKIVFIDPVANALKAMVDGIKSLFSGLAQALAAPFTAAANMIKGVVNNIIGGIERGINGAISALNRMIAGANAALSRLRLPGIPTIPTVSLPRFAEGGVVSGPTVAMVGEGGEPEYIVPQSKAAGFAANWMAGRRGAAAIPRFAEGGVVVPSNAQVSIQTGPVTQMNGANYVTTQDLSRAVQAGVQQTLDLMRNDRSTRRAVGLA